MSSGKYGNSKEFVERQKSQLATPTRGSEVGQGLLLVNFGTNCFSDSFSECFIEIVFMIFDVISPG